MIPQTHLNKHILSVLAAILITCDLVLASPSGFSGGSGYGGGGYYRGGNYDDYDWNSSSSNQDAYTGILLFVILSIIFCFFYKKGLETASDSRWTQKIHRAEVAVMSDAALPRPLQRAAASPFTFSSATFRALYTDNSQWGSGQSSRGYMIFRKPGHNTETTSLTARVANPCLTISGLGEESNASGLVGRHDERRFTIVKGMVSPLSGKCFWVEKFNHERRQVLVTGSFHISSGVSFQGRWQAKNGDAGFFSSFDMIPHFNDSGLEADLTVVRAIAMPAAEAVPINYGDCEWAVPVEVDSVDRVDNDFETSIVQNAVVEHAVPGRCYEVLPEVMDRTGYEEFHDVLETAPHVQAVPAPVTRVPLGYGDPVW